MTTQTLLYVIILPILFAVIRYIREVRARQSILLIVSYFLYASFGIGFLVLLVGSSFVNYLFGRWIRIRQTLVRLWLGIAANLALLATFKYSTELLPLLHNTRLSPLLSHLVLPIGISFWTFQALSYLFDTYRNEPIEPSLIEFLLYMAFWPTVLSGPICRLPAMLPQFRDARNSTLNDVQRGMDRICIGLFLIALSDVLANGWVHGQGVNDAYRAFNPNFSALDVWCMTLGFGFQLFFNFAGYSHIVIGAARLFGFTLAENFDRPFLSLTPSEFWARWHMSLSFWIRDYLFLPLATLGRTRFWRNVALVGSMLIFGLWHKGTVLLAIWGTYQGILLVIHRQFQEVSRRLNWTSSSRLFDFACWSITMTSINLGWLFFRPENLSQSLEMLRSVTKFSNYSALTLPHNLYLSVLVLMFGYFMAVGVQITLRERIQSALLPLEARLALYSAAVYFGVLHSAETQAFAYFKF